MFLADHGGRQGIHDLDLRLPDGRLAAVEVTSYTRPGHAETAGILSKQEWQWPAVGDRTWSIRVDPAVNLGAFKARYAAIIAAMDQANVAHPEHLPLTTQFEHPDVWWLLHQCPMSITVTAVKTATGEPPPASGFTRESTAAGSAPTTYRRCPPPSPPSYSKRPSPSGSPGSDLRK